MAVVKTFEFVSPKQAQEWHDLEGPVKDREVNDRRARAIAADIVAGRWRENTEIAFYDDGSRADGKHRLRAIVIANIGVWMWVARGYPRGHIFDDHRPRSVQDQIRLSGAATWIGKDEVSVIKKLDVMIGRYKHLGAYDVLDLGEAWKPAIQFAVAHMASHRKLLSTALLKACVASAWFHESENRLTEFCDVMNSGEVQDPKEDGEAIRLREWILRTKPSSQRIGETEDLAAMRRIQRAIFMFCRKRKSNLKCPDEMTYTVKRPAAAPEATR